MKNKPVPNSKNTNHCEPPIIESIKVRISENFCIRFGFIFQVGQNKQLSTKNVVIFTKTKTYDLMLDILLIILGFIFLFSGIIGCVLPVIPGPPLSYIGLLMLHFTKKYHFEADFLFLWATIAIGVTILDYYIPIWGAKKYGASKRAIWGSIIGLLFGLFLFPPFGIIIGPFVGAVIGEYSIGKNSSEALRSGFGTFMGFLGGTLIKLIVSGLMLFYYIKEMMV